MSQPDLLKTIARKNSDAAKIAERVMSAPEVIDSLIAGLGAAKPAIRYKSEKIIRIISARRPALIYPHFDLFASMLDGGNTFLKWGAIISIANLTHVDVEGKFDSIFDRYYSPIAGPEMITAANIIGGSSQIVLAKPFLADRISREILKVERGNYKTEECRNVAIGAAIDAFDRFLGHITDKDSIIRFVRRQVDNPRPSVRKKAEKFLARHTA